jgi:hypothetical protein
MSNYKTILEKLRAASADDSNIHCFKVLDQFISVFESMRHRKIPMDKFKGIVSKLEESLSKNTLYLRELTALKTEITEGLRKEFGLTTKFYYRFKWTFNGMLYFGLPLGLMVSAFYYDEGFLVLASLLGIALGLVLGLAIGTAKDQKAARNGKRLSII